MSPTEMEQNHSQLEYPRPPLNVQKYAAQFFINGTTVPDAPPPSGHSPSLPSSPPSNSGSQRALRSAALRYATFQGWPHDYMSTRLLADAGFFFIGVRDQTQCAFCCITISQWEPNDDPMTEHRRYAPNCPFVLDLPVGNTPLPMRTDGSMEAVTPPPPPPTTLSTIPPLFRTGYDTCSRRNEPRPNAVPERAGESSSSLMIRQDDSVSGPSDFSQLRVQMHQRARHPELTTQEARLKTFQDWPASLTQRPIQLAEAGFFYMGTGDHVKCFCCDGALRNWEPTDEPWVEHSRWFSQCNYLLTVKGEDYVKQVHSNFKEGNPCEKKSETEKEEAKQSPSNEEAACGSDDESVVSVGSIGSAGSSNSSLKEALLCKICFDQQMSIVFLPCGHSLSCPSCATALSTCPLCRKEIQATVRAYFSFS